MALKSTDLSVVKSEGVAQILAITIWEAVDRAEQDGDQSALARSVNRMTRRFAHEILELHDLKPDEVLIGGPTT